MEKSVSKFVRENWLSLASVATAAVAVGAYSDLDVAGDSLPMLQLDESIMQFERETYMSLGMSMFIFPPHRTETGRFEVDTQALDTYFADRPQITGAEAADLLQTIAYYEAILNGDEPTAGLPDSFFVPGTPGQVFRYSMYYSLFPDQLEALKRDFAKLGNKQIDLEISGEERVYHLNHGNVAVNYASNIYNDWDGQTFYNYLLNTPEQAIADLTALKNASDTPRLEFQVMRAAIGLEMAINRYDQEKTTQLFPKSYLQKIKRELALQFGDYTKFELYTGTSSLYRLHQEEAKQQRELWPNIINRLGLNPEITPEISNSLVMSTYAQVEKYTTQPLPENTAGMYYNRSILLRDRDLSDSSVVGVSESTLVHEYAHAFEEENPEIAFAFAKDIIKLGLRNAYPEYQIIAEEYPEFTGVMDSFFHKSNNLSLSYNAILADLDNNAIQAILNADKVNSVQRIDYLRNTPNPAREIFATAIQNIWGYFTPEQVPPQFREVAFSILDSSQMNDRGYYAFNQRVNRDYMAISASVVTMLALGLVAVQESRKNRRKSRKTEIIVESNHPDSN